VSAPPYSQQNPEALGPENALVAAAAAAAAASAADVAAPATARPYTSQRQQACYAQEQEEHFQQPRDAMHQMEYEHMQQQHNRQGDTELRFPHQQHQQYQRGLPEQGNVAISQEPQGLAQPNPQHIALHSNSSSSTAEGAHISRAARDGPNSLRCDVCGNSFARKSNLLKHRRSVHATTRKHVCNICGFAFKRYDHLSKHGKSSSALSFPSYILVLAL
jgi:uncharacterized C2H2 Zn-finger protein